MSNYNGGSVGPHQQAWGLSDHNYAEQPLKGSLKDKILTCQSNWFFFLFGYNLSFGNLRGKVTISSVLLPYDSTLLKFQNPEQLLYLQTNYLTFMIFGYLDIFPPFLLELSVRAILLLLFFWQYLGTQANLTLTMQLRLVFTDFPASFPNCYPFLTFLGWNKSPKPKLTSTSSSFCFCPLRSIRTAGITDMYHCTWICFEDTILPTIDLMA